MTIHRAFAILFYAAAVVLIGYAVLDLWSLSAWGFSLAGGGALLLIVAGIMLIALGRYAWRAGGSV